MKNQCRLVLREENGTAHWCAICMNPYEPERCEFGDRTRAASFCDKAVIDDPISHCLCEKAQKKTSLACVTYFNPVEKWKEIQVTE